LKEKNGEEDSKHIEKLIKSSIRGIRTNYKGRIAEDVVIKFLESKGYLVDRFCDLRDKFSMGYYTFVEENIALRKLNRSNPPEKFGTDEWYNRILSWNEESDKLLELGVDWDTYREKMIPIVEKLKEKQKIKVEEGKKLIKKWGKENTDKIVEGGWGFYYQVDLLASKDGKLYIVEVKSSKTGEMYWHGDQKERFDEIHFKHGFPTILVSVPINIDVDISVGIPKIEEILEQ
jgi:Holliday junction resolvase-like predicted endonuclease